MTYPDLSKVGVRLPENGNSRVIDLETAVRRLLKAWDSEPPIELVNVTDDLSEAVEDLRRVVARLERQ